MKVWERFAEYAVAGGLFWILMILLTAIFPSEGYWLTQFEKYFTSQVSEALANNETIFSPFLQSLAIISVFCTGILIELISPTFFAHFEMLYFKRVLIKENISCFNELFAQENETFPPKRNYNLFCNTHLYDFKNIVHWWRQRHRYIQLRAYLITYVFAKSEPDSLSDFRDRFVLWRTSRAIAGSIVLVAIIINCLIIAPFNLALPQVIRSVAAILVLWVLSGFLSIGQFARMCNSIISNIYLINEKEGRRESTRSISRESP